MSKEKKPEPKPSEKFKSAMKVILSVPKAEIDRREQAYQKQRSLRQGGNGGELSP